MKKLFLIFSLFCLTAISLSGCSNNHLSPKQKAKLNFIDSEAQTNLGAIFTDETAFNATNSMYISAGYNSTNKGTVNLNSTISPHKFYRQNIYNPTNSSLKCINGVLEDTSGHKIKSGFPNLGFLPKGELYFYYFVKVLPQPSKGVPKKLTKLPFIPIQPYVSCGNGFEAYAISNITSNNIQVYEINDYTSSPVLVYGKPYTPIRNRINR